MLKVHISNQECLVSPGSIGSSYVNDYLKTYENESYPEFPVPTSPEEWKQLVSMALDPATGDDMFDFGPFHSHVELNNEESIENVISHFRRWLRFYLASCFYGFGAIRRRLVRLFNDIHEWQATIILEESEEILSIFAEIVAAESRESFRCSSKVGFIDEAFCRLDYARLCLWTHFPGHYDEPFDSKFEVFRRNVYDDFSDICIREFLPFSIGN
jgi:hypothetical protein